MAKIFVVIDDHTSVLTGTRSALQTQYPEAQVETACAAAAAAALVP